MCLTHKWLPLLMKSLAPVGDASILTDCGGKHIIPRSGNKLGICGIYGNSFMMDDG